MKKVATARFGLLAGMIFIAAISRLLPHPPNFTPVTAIALFGGSYLLDRRLALLVPLLAMWISDLILNNVVYAAYFESFSWFGSLYVYAALLLITFLGIRFLQKRTVPRLLGVSLSASLLFFLVTNFGSWMTQPIYTKDLSGLMQAYVAGLPFLRNTVLGDLLYTGLLFGLFEWLKFRYPTLQTARSHAG